MKRLSQITAILLAQEWKAKKTRRLFTAKGFDAGDKTPGVEFAIKGNTQKIVTLCRQREPLASDSAPGEAEIDSPVTLKRQGPLGEPCGMRCAAEPGGGPAATHALGSGERACAIGIDGHGLIRARAHSRSLSGCVVRLALHRRGGGPLAVRDSETPALDGHDATPTTIRGAVDLVSAPERASMNES